MKKSREILIAGNWKMNHGPSETAAYFSQLREKTDQFLSKKDLSLLTQGIVQACIIPPAVSLEKAQTLARAQEFPVVIAAQNAHWEKKGAFTGEISGPMLQEIGIQWVLLGHSERRQLFGETGESLRRRADSLLAQGFRIILCIGETLAEREAGKTQEVLTRQLREVAPEAQKGFASFLNGKVVIAYEPVWAIGTGKTATPQQAEEAHEVIRSQLRERFGDEAAAKTPLLYGGSVTPENAETLLRCPNVDGALVGGASLKPESFLALLQAAVHRAQGDPVL